MKGGGKYGDCCRNHYRNHFYDGAVWQFIRKKVKATTVLEHGSGKERNNITMLL